MLESRRSEAWDHTASLMALLANINRDPKKRAKPFTLVDFHPTRAPLPEPKPPRVPITILRDVFCRAPGKPLVLPAN